MRQYRAANHCARVLFVTHESFMQSPREGEDDSLAALVKLTNMQRIRMRMIDFRLFPQQQSELASASVLLSFKKLSQLLHGLLLDNFWLFLTGQCL